MSSRKQKGLGPLITWMTLGDTKWTLEGGVQITLDSPSSASMLGETLDVYGMKVLDFTSKKLALKFIVHKFVVGHPPMGPHVHVTWWLTPDFLVFRHSSTSDRKPKKTRPGNKATKFVDCILGWCTNRKLLSIFSRWSKMMLKQN